jgi:predicted ATPase
LVSQLARAQYATEINLQRLVAADTRALISARFGNAPVRAEFSDAIQAITDGNPFFIEETLKSLVAEGDIYKASGDDAWSRKALADMRIPRTVEDAVLRRFA